MAGREDQQIKEHAGRLRIEVLHKNRKQGKIASTQTPASLVYTPGCACVGVTAYVHVCMHVCIVCGHVVH
jgi:hypothetical protein